jgi:hypothetical protein
VLLALLIKVLKVLKILLLKQQSKRIFDLMTDSIEPVKKMYLAPVPNYKILDNSTETFCVTTPLFSSTRLFFYINFGTFTTI